MRKLLLLFLLSFLFIAGGVLGVRLIKEKLEPKFLNPVSGEVFSGLLVKALESKNLAVKSLPLEFSDEIVASISGVNIIFPKVSDYSELVKTLQTVLNGATMGKKIIEVDLRFSKPVIKYGP